MFVGKTTEVGGVSYPVCADGVNMVFLGDTAAAPFQASHILAVDNSTAAAPGAYGTDEYSEGAAWQEEKHGRWPWNQQAGV